MKFRVGGLGSFLSYHCKNISNFANALIHNMLGFRTMGTNLKCAWSMHFLFAFIGCNTLVVKHQANI